MDITKETFDEDWQTASLDFPWRSLAMSLLLLALPFLAGKFLFAVRFAEGARFLAPSPIWQTAKWVVIHALAIQVLLSWPVQQFALPFAEQKLGRWAGAAFLSAFFVPPLLSYLSFEATKSGHVVLSSLALMVIPGACTAGIWLATTRHTWVVTLWLSVTVCVPLYLLNDVMAPFFTLWNFYPQANEMRWLQLVGWIGILGISLSLLRFREQVLRP